MPPLLDVTVVLNSPMFMTTFTVVRRVNSVDDYGRTVVNEDRIELSGVIVPAGLNTQERPKEYATGRRSIAVYTQFRLRPQVDGSIPDLVLYRGDDYLVETVEDYTVFGAGFVQAYCTSQDLQDQPPED